MPTGSNAETLAPLIDQILNGKLHYKLVFQPIVDLRRGTTVGYEALVRFPEEIGMAPDVCFRAAEICNRRLPLEQAILMESVKTAEKLPPDCFLSINVSPALLMSDHWDTVMNSEPDFSRIVFEITEQDPVDDYDALRSRIDGVKVRGGHVAVDDAGAGYASLRHAMELRPNFLKLDRYFVGECHGSHAKSTLIEMIGKAASRMDAWIVAEGIENLDELDELIRLEVPLGQGYFLGRPAPEMLPLPPERALEIAARTHAMSQQNSLMRVVESCVTIAGNSGGERWASTALNGSHSVMVLDTHDRPVELFEPHALLGWQSLTGLMRVQEIDAISDALHRALTRPKHQRFDTLAVVDERGAFRGIVRIDKLIQAMLHGDVTTPYEVKPQHAAKSTQADA